jgi:hypothetical protein
MILALSIAGIILLVFVAFNVKVKSMQRNEAVSVQTGLKLMTGMQKLIELLQQHRGITNAYHQGNASLKNKLLSIEQDVELIINGQLQPEFSKFDQWHSFVDHWPRLKKHSLAADLSAQNIMRQHHIMIDGQISLLDEITRYFELHFVMLDRFTRVSEICLDTIRTAETIAKARGVGSGICAKGVREGADSISLNYLKISMDSSTNQLFKELSDIDNTDLRQRFSSYSVSIKRSVDKLVNVLEKDILPNKQINLDSQEYFNVATAPIIELVSLYSYVVNYALKRYEKAY